MTDRQQEPFVFTNQIVQQLLENDWTLGVLSGGGQDSPGFDELLAGEWSDKQVHRIRSMDFVPGDSDPNRRHRFVLHAWDGYLDHMIESRREHGWKNEYTTTLAALATHEEWIGHTTMNPGAYHDASTRPGGRAVRKTLVFTQFDIELIESLIRDALIDTRTDGLQDFDF